MASADAMSQVREHLRTDTASSKIFLRRSGAGVKKYQPRDRSGKALDFANAWKDTKSTGIKDKILASDEFRYMQRVNTVKRDRRTIEEVQMELRGGPARKGKSSSDISVDQFKSFLKGTYVPWDDNPEVQKPAPRREPTPPPVGPDRVLISEAMAKTAQAAASSSSSGTKRRNAVPAAASGGGRVPVPRSQGAPKPAPKGPKRKSKLDMIRASVKRTHNGFFQRDLKYLGVDPEKAKEGKIVPRPFEGATNIQPQGSTLHGGRNNTGLSGMNAAAAASAAKMGIPVRLPPGAKPAASGSQTRGAAGTATGGARTRPGAATANRSLGLSRTASDPSSTRRPGVPALSQRIPGQLQRVPGQMAQTSSQPQRPVAANRHTMPQSAPRPTAMGRMGKSAVSPLAAARKGMSGRLAAPAYGRTAPPPPGMYAPDAYEDEEEEPDEYEYDSFVEEDEEEEDPSIAEKAYVAKHMQSIVGMFRGKRRYESDEDDLADMEASVHDIEREEARSRAAGRRADLQEEHELQQHALQKKRRFAR